MSANRTVLSSGRGIALLTVMLVTLSGCSTTSERKLDASTLSPASAAGVQRPVDSSTVGSIVTFPGSGKQARVLSQYSAASGRQCRRLSMIDDSDEIRVACQAADGEWRLRRSLSAVYGLHQFPNPQDAADEVVKVAGVTESDRSDGFLLRSGETLWSFARRTTGSGEHWPAIADLNNLEQPERLHAGESLLVPIALSRRSAAR